MSLDTVVASLVEGRRLGGDGARRRFTVARREAVMKLRAAAPVEGLGWMLWVLRAARRLPGSRNLTWEVISKRGREQLVVAIEPSTAAASPGGSDAADGELELAGLLSAGLSADARVETPADVRALDRAAAALGAALNAILATGPRAVTIEAGAARRRWHRDDAGARDRGGDPYDELREDLDGAGEDGGIDNLSVRMTVTYDQSLGRWLGRILGIRRGRFEGLDAFAYGRAVRSLGDEGPLHPEEMTALVQRQGASGTGRIELGSGGSWRPPMTIVIPGFGWFVPAEGEATWLLRDGVRVLDLAPALRGIGVKPPGGMLEVDALSLTALGDDLVVDEACHAVAAWLDELERGVQLETGDDGQARVRPSERISFGTVGELGAPIKVANLEKTSRRLGELRFAWPHEIGRGGAGGGRRLSSHASGRPLGIDLRTLCLTPSEVASLSRRLPGIPVLHHAVVGRARRGGGGLDVERLARGSLAPLVLLEVASLRERAAALAGLGLRMAAYVPRKDSPFSGQHVVTFFGREVARVRLRPERPGIVVHTELLARTDHPPGMAELERHPGVLRWADRRARELLIAHSDDLLRLALTERNALKIPLVNRALRHVDARTLRLSYVADEALGARLTYRETPLLNLSLSGDGDDVITVRDTVEALREGKEGARMARARRDAPRRLERIWSLTAMDKAPNDPSAPGGSLGELLSTSEMRDALERSPRDGAARQRLRAHLLASLAAQGRDDGLSTVALFDVYDPVAREPWSQATLQELRQRSLPWVHPAAATRMLGRPVLPLRPWEARSLSRVLEVPEPDAVSAAFSTASGRATRGGSVGVSAPGDAGIPRVTSRIEHPLAWGEVWIEPAPGGGGVELWHDGLRIELLRMRGALGALSGHLELRTRTPPTSSGIATLRTLLRGEGSALVEALGRRRALATPGGPERAALDAAWARIRGDVSLADAPGLRARLLLASPPEDPDPDLSLRLDAMVTRLVHQPPGVWIMRLIDKGLAMRAKLSRFSSRSVRVEVPARAGAPLTLRVGLRHRWNRRVLGRGMRRGEVGPTPWEYLVASVIITLESTAAPSMLSRLGSRGRRRWLVALVELAAELDRVTRQSRAER